MVIWTIFIFYLVILIIIGLNRGFGKNIISFLVNLVDCFIAFIISRIAVNTLVDKIGSKIISNINSEYALEIDNWQVIENFIHFTLSIIIGLAFFYLFYLIFLIISLFVKHLFLYKKFEKIKFDNKIATIVVSVFSATLTFVILFTPFGMLINSFAKIPEIGNGKKALFTSELFFDLVTEMPNNENKIKTSKELNYSLNSYVAAINIVNNINQDKDNVKIFKNNFKKSYFLPTVISEFGSAAAKQWKEGKEFGGSQIEIPRGREGKLIIGFLEIVEKWDKDAVVNDVNTILDISKIMTDYGTDKLQEEDGLIKSLTDEKYLEDIFVELYGNNDFGQMIPVIAEYGLGTVFDTINIELNEEYSSKIDVTKMSKEEVKKEANIISNIVKVALEVKEESQNNNGEISRKNMDKLINEVSKLQESKVLADITNELIDQLNNNVDASGV